MKRGHWCHACKAWLYRWIHMSKGHRERYVAASKLRLSRWSSPLARPGRVERAA